MEFDSSRRKNFRNEDQKIYETWYLGTEGMKYYSSSNVCPFPTKPLGVYHFSRKQPISKSTNDWVSRGAVQTHKRITTKKVRVEWWLVHPWLVSRYSSVNFNVLCRDFSASISTGSTLSICSRTSNPHRLTCLLSFVRSLYFERVSFLF